LVKWKAATIPGKYCFGCFAQAYRPALMAFNLNQKREEQILKLDQRLFFYISYENIGNGATAGRHPWHGWSQQGANE
jgi:hypothetical protein